MRTTRKYIYSKLGSKNLNFVAILGKLVSVLSVHKERDRCTAKTYRRGPGGEVHFHRTGFTVASFTAEPGASGVTRARVPDLTDQ